jgi:ribose transport system substrate-binding protein
MQLGTSHMRGRKRSSRAGLTACLGVAVAIVLSVAGAAYGSSPRVSGATSAKTLVTQAEKRVAGPSLPSFDAKTLKGDKVWFVSYALSIPYSQQVLSGVKQASKALGFQLKSFDGNFSAAAVSRGIGLAVAAKAKAVIVHSIAASEVAAAVKSAEAHGVKVISAETQNPGATLAGTPKGIAFVSHSYSAKARAMAAEVASSSGGNANVLFLSANDIGPGSAEGTATFKTTLKRMCPKCTVQAMDEPVSQWSQLQTQIASLLQKDPSINYVVPIFDGMVEYLVPGIQSAGLATKVKIVTGDGTASVLQNIKDHEIVVGDAAQPNVWTGIAIMDQTARVLAGVKPVADENIPFRLITSQNVGQLNLKLSLTDPWFTNSDVLADYERIWELKK